MADTNFLVRALVGNGISAAIFAALDKSRTTLITSAPLIAELARILQGNEFAAQVRKRGLTTQGAVDRVVGLAEVVQPDFESEFPVRDLDDRVVLQTAAGGHADVIVTSDSDLLVLNGIVGIAIIRPADLLHTLGLHRER